MNHRRSRRGYHSLRAVGTSAVVLLQACAQVQVRTPAPHAPASPGTPWRAERAAVVAQINASRAQLGLPPLAYGSLLERVGDKHCEIIIEEGGDGHFSRSGVPPYLRYLLAGGRGFHRENVSAYSTTGTVTEAELGGILRRSVEEMLAEVSPDDGHRRSLLDPWVTHIGVGLAVRGGEVRMTHELATEVAESWEPPPPVAEPGMPAELSGKLAGPWRAEAVEVLWEELPRPLPDARLRAIRAYGYPKRRAVAYANRPDAPGTAPTLDVDRFGAFRYRWSSGPHEGVEIVLVLARHGNDHELVPVAASGTVVVGTGRLPSELALWQGLGARPTRR